MTAPQLSDLGSSQQCEHANWEVSLRAPKSLNYKNSESLDFRVKATAAFINERRHYISQESCNGSVYVIYLCYCLIYNSWKVYEKFVFEVFRIFFQFTVVLQCFFMFISLCCFCLAIPV